LSEATTSVVVVGGGAGGWDWLFGMYFGKTCLKSET
jgi:hypothetical protein